MISAIGLYLLPLTSASAAEPEEQASSSWWPLRRLQGLFAFGSSTTTAQQPQTPQFPTGKLGGTIDAWATDRDLRAAQRLLDGDHWALMGEMVSNPDLDAIWSDPLAARRLLEANPILEALPGVAALAAKAPKEFTAQDVRGRSG